MSNTLNKAESLEDFLRLGAEPIENCDDQEVKQQAKKRFMMPWKRKAFCCPTGKSDHVLTFLWTVAFGLFAFVIPLGLMIAKSHYMWVLDNQIILTIASFLLAGIVKMLADSIEDAAYEKCVYNRSLEENASPDLINAMNQTRRSMGEFGLHDDDFDVTSRCEKGKVCDVILRIVDAARFGIHNSCFRLRQRVSI